MRRFLARCLGGFALFGASIGLAIPTAWATDLKKDTSLALVPPDADFYSSSLRLKEQWTRFLGSKFVDEIKQVEVVQQVIQKIRDEWDAAEGPIGQAKAYLKTPLVQDFLALAEEMASQEVFVMGDGHFSKCIMEMVQMQQEISTIVNSDGPEGVLAWIDSLTKEEFDEIPVPTFVIGFRINDQERALTILDQLQGIVAAGIGMVPQLAPVSEAFDRVEDSRGTRLVLTLTSDMIPWDQIPDQGEEQQQVFEKFRELFEDREITLTFGQLDSYVIIAFSEGQKPIAELGKSGSLLDNPQLQPLKDKAGEDISAIMYVSDKMSDAQFQANFKDYFSKQYANLAPLIENEFGDDLPEFLENLEDDLAWLDERMDGFVPEFKGSLGFAFLTSTGQEGYTYNRTEDVLFDGSKKLDILQHVGKDPYAFFACREQYHLDWLKFAREVAQKCKGYLEAALDAEVIEGEQAQQTELFLEKGWPLLSRLADLVEQNFVPAMKDGQHAWVLQFGNLESEQWFKEMPRSDEPLPLPELAFTAGVSDKQLLIDGFVGVFSWGDSIVELLRELEPNSVPEGYSIPRPEHASHSKGDKYLYAIPDNCPAPKEMAPQAIIDDHYMICTYSEKLANEVSNSSSLAAAAKSIEAGQNLANASYVDFGRIAKAMTPWVRYAIITQVGDLDAMVIPEEDTFPGMSGKSVMQIWSAFSHMGTFASSTTIDKKGSVIHWTYVGD